MAGVRFQLGQDGLKARDGSPVGRIVLFLFGTPFAAFGLFAVWGGIKKLHDTGSKEGIFISLFGLVFAAVGFGLMYAAITAERRRKAAEDKWRAQTDGGTKPWLARADWAAGRIKSTATAPVKFFILWSVLALGLSAPALWQIPREWEKGNHMILVALAFPAVALYLIGYTVVLWRSRRRFGECHFEPASVPGVLGGTLEGLVQTSARIPLEHGLALRLSCIRLTVSGSGKNRTTHEVVLWQDEKILNPAGGLPETEPGRSGIPVYFKIPADQPESSSEVNASVFWRLEARAKMAGPDFTAAFDVPVFRVAGAEVAADEPDPTVPLQMRVEELRRDEHSRIEVTNGPRGREFHFPAARNPGPAIFVSLFALGATAGTVALIVNHVSYFAATIVGLIAVVAGIASINLLFKSSCATVNSSGVTLQNRWLVFARSHQFDAHEITRFDTKVGMTSGTRVFHDIKLVTRSSEESFAARKARYQRTGERPALQFRVRDPSGVTLGSAVGSSTEAKWLVQEMTRALGRREQTS